MFFFFSAHPSRRVDSSFSGFQFFSCLACRVNRFVRPPFVENSLPEVKILFRSRTAQLARSPFAHARAGASQRAPTQRLRSVHTTHCVAMAFPCACDGLALLHLPPPSPPPVPKLCSAAAIALTASLCRTRHQRHLTRTRSLSLTLRAVAARVFAHRLGAPAALSCSFRCHVTSTPRGRDSRCCVGSLGHSVTTRCAEQQRRGAASHRRWPTALPTESFVPPPPSISLNSPRDRTSVESHMLTGAPIQMAPACCSCAPIETGPL